MTEPGFEKVTVKDIFKESEEYLEYLHKIVNSEEYRESIIDKENFQCWNDEARTDKLLQKFANEAGKKFYALFTAFVIVLEKKSKEA